MTYEPRTLIQADDSYSVDAFGRWRVSNLETIFDSKQIFNDPDLADNIENYPLFFDNQQTSGTGTSTAFNVNTASTTLSVSNATAGTRVRQSKMRFNYQPGKSQAIFASFVLGAQSAGITRRVGYFDQNNGLFLEDNGSSYRFVRRTFTSGSAVDNAVDQSSWNEDKMDGTGPSGITLDFTKAQILFVDLEWLGAGRVRMGFVVDGKIYYAHEFLNANNLTIVYMSSPNLPIRAEISNSGAGPAADLMVICSSVASEGGLADLGSVRRASNNGTHVDLADENTVYGVIGLRLKPSYLGAAVKILNVNMQIHTATDRVEWILYYNPTITGTFTWTDNSQSAVQIGRAAAAGPTITNGYQLDGGYIESGNNATGNSGSSGGGINNAIRLGSLIDGTPDTIVLCARPIAGSSDVDVEGSITWRELL